MNIIETRREYKRAWKAWRKANEIRKALANLTGDRNGPAKKWVDECRVMLSRAERAHRREVRELEQAEKAVSDWRRRNPVLSSMWECDLSVCRSREQIDDQLMYGVSISRMPS